MGDVDNRMVSLISSLPPLSYNQDMADAIMEYAAASQAILVHGGGIMGANAPILLPGQLLCQNATTLAGIILAQLVNPGTAVFYGTSGSALAMMHLLPV